MNVRLSHMLGAHAQDIGFVTQQLNPFYFQIQIVTSATVTESIVSELAASSVKMASTSPVHTVSIARLNAPNVLALRHAPNALRADMDRNVSTRATAYVLIALAPRNARHVSLGVMVRFVSFTVHLVALTYSARRILANAPSAVDTDTI